MRKRGNLKGSLCWGHQLEASFAENRREDLDRKEHWEVFPSAPDLQCAWQILLQSANPRANHAMRTMHPSLSAACCVWPTTKEFGPPPKLCWEGSRTRARKRCMRWRRCPCEWAVWGCVRLCVVLLPLSGLHGCLEELREAATGLERKGFWWQSVRWNLATGRDPLQNDACDPGGWQSWAQEDLIVDWPSSFAPCSLEVAFGAQRWHCVVPCTHGTRVHSSSTPLPLERLAIHCQSLRHDAAGAPNQGRHLAACPRTGPSGDVAVRGGCQDSSRWTGQGGFGESPGVLEGSEQGSHAEADRARAARDDRAATTACRHDCCCTNLRGMARFLRVA